jgi:peroxiredoxin
VVNSASFGKEESLVKNGSFNWPVWAGVIRRYDLVHAGAGEDGRDIARPAEFLVDSTGTVRWVNLTENYWVRARPDQFIEAAKALR